MSNEGDIILRDDGGIKIKTKEAKIYYGKSTWSTRIGYFLRNDKAVFISTYSLPDLDYVKELFSKHGCKHITILAHKKFHERAKEIKREFPEVEIYLEDDNHEKVVLCEPETIIIGSANFGHSGWRETMVGLKSKAAYETMLSQYHERFKCAEKVENKE